MSEMVFLLPGEGEVTVVTKVTKRATCQSPGCPNKATRVEKYIGHCDVFTCDEHHDSMHPYGAEWVLSFPMSEQFAKLFLFTEEQVEKRG